MGYKNIVILSDCQKNAWYFYTNQKRGEKLPVFLFRNISPVNLIPDRGYLEVIPFLEEGIQPFH
jgi:hypothetical protein